MRQAVHIFGAGFSGLVTAWALNRRGAAVVVHEKSSRPGGLISTPHSKFGSYETAANALMSTALVEELFGDLGLEAFRPTPVGRRKFIYRDSPRRWPLTFGESAGLLGRWVSAKAKGEVLPRAFETLDQWGRRVLGPAATSHLLSPAIQGIYAGDPNRLSATLLLGRVLQREKGPKPKIRGSVFPKNGMQQLIERLVETIESRGAKVHFNSSASIADFRNEGPVVLAAAAPDAAKALATIAPEAAVKLGSIQMLPLAVVELYVPQADRPLGGFGCLFPRNAGFHSLGVLFDHYLYPHRFQASAERWILGGARHPGITALGDTDILELVAADHRRLGGRGEISGSMITRWPSALPDYTIELERILSDIPLPKNIFLIGNYLGRIGLSQILAKAVDLAGRLAEKHDA